VQTCSKCHIQSPDEVTKCPNCGADLTEWSETATALKRFQQNPRVLYVRIMVQGDCCPICSQAEGAYAKELAPQLPIPGCSHPLGCRCFVQPVLDEVYP
jgi:RNA polymerase subunit RPABC4/transcription elongation factor Spt4